jgi:hypothetical protein
LCKTLGANHIVSEAVFEGKLREGLLANTLQYLSLNQVTGCLLLRKRSGVTGKVFFDQGRLVHAVADKQLGVTALARLLTWQNGRFGFFEDVPSPARTIKISLDHALMQASYEVDVSTRLHAPLTADSVLKMHQDMPEDLSESTNTTVSLDLKTLLLLRYIDGRMSLGSIAERFGVPLVDILQPADELLLNNMVQVTTRGQFLEPSFIDELTEVSLDIVSPVADVLIEDLLRDLGLTVSTVSEEDVVNLLEALKRYCQSSRSQNAFDDAARALCHQYGVTLVT